MQGELGTATALPPRAGRAALAGSADLVALIGLTLSLPALVWLALPALQVPVGLLVVLLGPGYAVIAALFVRAGDIDLPAQLGLSIGLSLAILPVVALVLDALPWGIRAWPMIMSLLIIIITFSLLALLRRQRAGGAALQVALPAGREARRQLRPALVALGVALLLAGVLAGLNRHVLPPTTELYVLGPGQLVADYPRRAVVGQPITVQVGIINHEGRAMTYHLSAEADGAAVGGAAPFAVAANATWERPLTLTLTQPGRQQPINLLLFQSDQPAPYRRLQLVLDVAVVQP